MQSHQVICGQNGACDCVECGAYNENCIPGYDYDCIHDNFHYHTRCVGTTTQGGSQVGVHVEHTFTVDPSAYPAGATGLHFKVWQKEDNVQINGWKVTIPQFWDAASQRGNQPEPWYSDGDDGNHAVEVQAHNGLVPYFADLTIKVELWLSSWNTARIADVGWTATKNNDPRSADIPNHGWTIANPQLIKSGIGGHRFTIANDDPSESMPLGDLSFAWSFVNYSIGGDELPIPPDTIIYGPFFLVPGDSLVIDLLTGDGSAREGNLMVGGHIYGKYVITGAAGPSVNVFDHYVVPTTLLPAMTPGGLIILLLLLTLAGAFVVYKRRRGVAR